MCTRLYSGILYYYFVRGSGGFKYTSRQWDVDGFRFVTVYECLSVWLSVCIHAKYRNNGHRTMGGYWSLDEVCVCVCVLRPGSLWNLTDNITILISPIRQRYDILSSSWWAWSNVRVFDRRAKYIIEEDLMTREKSTVDKSVQPRGRERERSRLPACLMYNIRRCACLPFGGQNKEH